MFEISPALLILLVEGMTVLLIVLLLLVFLSKRHKGRKKRAVIRLIAQIKKQSEVRTRETGSFLQEIYQLEDDELNKAVQIIDKSEKRLFQKLVNSYISEDPSIIYSMDAAIAGLIDTYKALKPKERIIEKGSDENEKQLNIEVEALKEENEKLEEELTATKQKMTDMISEFGSMFGGGSDHEMANFEVVEKMGSTTPDKSDEIESPG
ncbi:MAG: hypothetical protein GY820_24950 [Gammaproteobacteria bacterium]|nr:hypothetical protein [Gammaproteobacteria bacterium]